MQLMFKKILISSICLLAALGNEPVCQAEISTYDGVGEYIMSDFETPDIAKQRAKARAEQNAVEQAGVYVKSYTRTVNHALVEDEIVAIANMIIKIVDVQYTMTPISEAGGSFQIVAKLRATVDSDRVDEWLKRDQLKNIELVEQNKQLQVDNAKLDKELTTLRKKLASVTNAQEKQTLEKKMVSADNKFLANQKIEEGCRLYSDGKYIEAVAMFSQAIGLDENNSIAYYGRGSAYAKQGNFTQAIDDFTKTIVFKPNDAVVYNNRGYAYSNQGNYMQAIADYSKAINLNPNLAVAYSNRGGAYDRQGKYIQAIADYTKAIALNPNYAAVYNLRGLDYGIQGNYIQAIADFTKAIVLNPNDAVAYYIRGIAYFNQGNCTQAIDDFKKAISLKPNYAAAYTARGMAYNQMGNLSQANADFAKGKELSGK